MSAPHRADILGDLFLVVEPGGGWPYATTNEQVAHDRAASIGCLVGRVPLVGDYRHVDQALTSEESP
ncbi:MAG TPA: hypothetical protein VK453_25270 [Micromonosporaceae bacterium]|nr:hypothetical protein [Micromonosporaceae bacterium]